MLWSQRVSRLIVYKMKLFRKQSSANAVESEREVNKSEKGKKEGGKI